MLQIDMPRISEDSAEFHGPSDDTNTQQTRPSRENSVSAWLEEGENRCARAADPHRTTLWCWQCDGATDGELMPTG